jgi:aryl-alcohol dehydrogenase-like predicted oxidoreductase
MRRFGDSGLEVSAVGLGCNNFGRRLDLDGTRAVVDAALSEGVTFFDTADIYGKGHSEEYLGDVLQGRRDQVVLATKFGMDMGDGKGPRGSRGYIRQAADASLRRLRTDVIDVYWYHEPDGQTPIQETLQTLDELVRAGKVRAIGASNFSAEQLEEADAVAREHGLTRFSAVQN